MTYLKGLFKTIDVIANPTCAQTAERILESDESGCWKFGATLRYMMYVKLANYSGIPSITVPSGFAPNGLPTGIMLSGNWYSEEVLFKIGHVLDLDHKREKPEVFTDLLQ
ncbi:Oidioi.mRNA.OKI2018_I69.PAR.g12634.t1.cds [Oikopleura dioica]|uniref:Oidioi.mRNA.OKI2018_I69.PAR.g12634.t1.cds n=1 Tax=Oikopleura dioica TaxID=34765 RepID=A0ABN7S738_OIKDI|nr:Oidioi.mRNA.OKI2018_I69.PAR.g12634.t1.cds [Oikopleura dioica]